MNFLLVALGQLIRLFGLLQFPAPTAADRGGIEIFFHLQTLCPAFDPPFGLFLGHATESRKIKQLIHQGIFGIKAPFFRQIPHVAGGCIQWCTVPEHLATIPGQHPQDHADGCCFAGAVGPQ